jgi:hypothetical protein
MAQNGFRMDGTPHEKVLDKGVVSKLEEIIAPTCFLAVMTVSHAQ